MRFVVYTDGGFDMDDCVGASALVILDKSKSKILYKWAKGRRCVYNPEKKQRCNEQELGAIIKAVMSVPKGSTLELYSDSQYAVKVLSGQWNASANLDLIQRFVEEKEKNHVDVDFRWVKGHVGNTYNEMADELCYQAAMNVRKTGQNCVFESKNLCYDM